MILKKNFDFAIPIWLETNLWEKEARKQREKQKRSVVVATSEKQKGHQFFFNTGGLPLEGNWGHCTSQSVPLLAYKVAVHSMGDSVRHLRSEKKADLSPIPGRWREGKTGRWAQGSTTGRIDGDRYKECYRTLATGEWGEVPQRKTNQTTKITIYMTHDRGTTREWAYQPCRWRSMARNLGQIDSYITYNPLSSTNIFIFHT